MARVRRRDGRHHQLRTPDFLIASSPTKTAMQNPHFSVLSHRSKPKNTHKKRAASAPLLLAHPRPPSHFLLSEIFTQAFLWVFYAACWQSRLQ